MSPSDYGSGLGRTYALAGDRSGAAKILQQLIQDSHKRGDLSLEIAYIYADLGDREQAFAWLEKAFQDREGGLLFLNSPLYFAPIRSDPRFADLVQRVGLGPGLAGGANHATQDRASSRRSVGNSQEQAREAPATRSEAAEGRNDVDDQGAGPPLIV